MSRSRRMPPLFEVMRETNPSRAPLPPPTPVTVPVRPTATGSGPAPHSPAPVIRPVATPGMPPPAATAGGPALALHLPADDGPADEPAAAIAARSAFRPGAWELNRQVTVPTKSILFIVAGIIVVLAVVWYFAWQMGHENARKEFVAREAKPDPTQAGAAAAPDPLATPTPASPSGRPPASSPPPKQPQDSPTRPPSSQPAAPGAVPAATLPAGADPRNTGQNYLCIVTLQKLEDAESVAAFLTRNGVPAGVVPMGKVDMTEARANNHTGWEVFALQGVPSGQYKASTPQREALERKVESLEAALNRELKSFIRLNAHLWKKY